MQLRTVLHRRFRGERGLEFVYVATSAAILGLDTLAHSIVAAFDVSEGLDANAWLETHSDRQAAETTLHDLIDLGVIRPVGEPQAPRAQLPPMPFPIATLVLNVTNKCNLTCTYCYEYGEDRIRSDAVARKPRMDAKTAFAAIDMLFESAGARPEVSLTFFGGETLLNFETIREAV